MTTADAKQVVSPVTEVVSYRARIGSREALRIVAVTTCMRQAHQGYRNGRLRTIHADIHTWHRRLERIIPRSRVGEVWSGSSALFASGHCTLDDLARTLAALSLRAESIRCMQIKVRRCSPARGLPIRSWPDQQTRRAKRVNMCFRPSQACRRARGHRR